MVVYHGTLTNGDLSSGTKSHHVSALCHVLTQYKVKVARHKQHTCACVCFLYSACHRTVAQRKRTELLRYNIPQAAKSTQALRHRHCVISRFGT